MGLESVINVVVSAAAPPLTEAGFGTPLILGTTARTGTDLVRYYTTLAGVLADYAVGTPEYRMAVRCFAQAKRPRRIAIGKRTSKPTQRFVLTPTVLSSTRYAFSVGADVVEYTSDASATLAEIIAGITAAFAALSPAPTTYAVTSTDTTTTNTITSATAGTWLAVQVLTPGSLSVKQNQADAGVTADLAAMLAESGEWYGVLTPFTSQAEVMAIAEWTEANGKLFFFATVDSATANVAYDAETPDDDVGGAIFSRNYARTLGTFQTSTADFTDVAAMARFFGAEPGSITMHLKDFVGPQPVALTATQQTNLKARNLNPYLSLAGSPSFMNGVVASGQFVDLVRDTDWFVARSQEALFRVMKGPEDKIPYTDDGVVVLSSTLAAQGERAEVAKFLRAGWTVTTQPVSTVLEADRAARRYPSLTFTGYYAGAIHTVDPLTVTFMV